MQKTNRVDNKQDNFENQNDQNTKSKIIHLNSLNRKINLPENTMRRQDRPLISTNFQRAIFINEFYLIDFVQDPNCAIFFMGPRGRAEGARGSGRAEAGGEFIIDITSSPFISDYILAA